MKTQKQTRKQQRSAKFETIMNHSDKGKKNALITTSSSREIRDEEEKKTGARYYTIKCLVVVINNHGNLKCLNVEGSGQFRFHPRTVSV